MSKYAKIQGLAARIYELRESGKAWSAEKPGDIVHTIRLEFPEYTTLSAIPARKLYQEYKAQVDKDAKLAKSKKAVTAARDQGLGWAHIAARTGLTVAEVKKLYTGDNPDGRVYVRADGTINVKLESTSANKVEVATPSVAQYSSARG